MPEIVRYELNAGIARITMDDGKLNVMSAAMLGALDGAFARAQSDGAIVVLRSARPVFSAGFDLKVFASGDADASLAMVRAGADLALKLLTFPAPIVVACAGHAYPMGAFLMLASDLRIGAAGAYRIGLNEVAIGIPVPSFALDLARARLVPAAFQRAALTGRMLGPDEAREAGFLDTVVANLDDAVDEAVAALRQIDLPSHALTKQRLRTPTIAAVRAAIEAELTSAAYRARGAANVRLP